MIFKSVSLSGGSESWAADSRSYPNANLRFLNGSGAEHVVFEQTQRLEIVLLRLPAFSVSEICRSRAARASRTSAPVSFIITTAMCSLSPTAMVSDLVGGAAELRRVAGLCEVFKRGQLHRAGFAQRNPHRNQPGFNPAENGAGQNQRQFHGKPSVKCDVCQSLAPCSRALAYTPVVGRFQVPSATGE